MLLLLLPLLLRQGGGQVQQGEGVPRSPLLKWALLALALLPRV